MLHGRLSEELIRESQTHEDQIKVVCIPQDRIQEG